MKTEVIGSDQDDRFWFRARITACREPYRRLYGIPTSLNPWAIRAQSRIRRFAPEWNGWTPRDAGILIDLLKQSEKTVEEDGYYEHILEYAVCVVAETSSQARSRAKTCLRNGSFLQFDLDAVGAKEAAALEATPAATRAIATQTAIHPLIGGEYSPPIPEIHLTSSSDEIAGVIRMELSREQLKEQISRVRTHRRRMYDWGRFKPEFELDQQLNKRMLAVIDAVAEDDTGILVASVPVTEDEPEVAVVLVLSHEWVKRIRNRATNRDFDVETVHWKFPIAESSLDHFLEYANEAIDTTSPRVVGPSPFVEPNEMTDAEMISAR